MRSLAFLLALASLAACGGKDVVDPSDAGVGVGGICTPTTPCAQPTDPHVSDCAGLWCIYPDGPPTSLTEEGICQPWQSIPGEPCLLVFPLPEGGTSPGVCNEQGLCVCVPVEPWYELPLSWVCGDGDQ